MDNKQQSAMKEKIKIISDFRLILKWFLSDDKKREFQYIYEIKPRIDNNELGIVSTLKSTIEVFSSKIIAKQGLQNEL